MDINEIRNIEKVVDRLAAQGPSGVSAAHCWFCGKIGAWWGCDCPAAELANQGKRPKPRWDDARGCIILNEATIRANEGRGYKRFPADGAALTSMQHPKGPGIGRGRGRLHVAALEIVEIELPVVDSAGEAVTQGVTPLPTESVTPSDLGVTLAPESVTPSRSPAAERQRRKRERDRAKQRADQ